MNAIEQLPSIANAKLPASYESAKQALAECVRIDECKDWADKAAALASYAEQARNDVLRKHAERIQARAIRRASELYHQIQPGQGARDGKRDNGSVTPLTRTEAAKEAGFSTRQQRDLARIGTIPEETFNELVDSDNPPTVSKLAELGTQKKPEPLVDLGGIPPEDYARATKAQGTLRRFAEFCEANEPTRIAKAFMPHEREELRKYVSIVDAWMDKFVTNLSE